MFGGDVLITYEIEKGYSFEFTNTIRRRVYPIPYPFVNINRVCIKFCTKQLSVTFSFLPGIVILR